MQTALITGGAGFIGFNLARALAPTCKKLVLCDNLQRGQLDADMKEFLNKNPHVTFVDDDLTQSDAYKKLGNKYDAVFHFAAILGVEIVERDPIKVVTNNLLSTIHLLNWFIRTKSRRLVFSSTSEVYADGVSLGTLPIPTPESVPITIKDIFHPRSSYAISKLVGEHLVAQYEQKYGFDFVIIRYHNVYGPRMGMDHVIPQMIQRLMGEENPVIVRSPGHTRSFCHVDDAVAATLSLMDTPAGQGLIVNVGNDRQEISILELVSLLCRIMGIERKLEKGPDQSGSVFRRCPDLVFLRRLTGFEPNTSLKEGLEQTWSWYQQNLLRRVS